MIINQIAGQSYGYNGVARLAIYDKDCADGYKIRGAEGKKTGSVAPII